MAEAANSTIVPRRAVLRGLASLPAISSLALVVPDPIYDAIADHKAALAFTDTVHEDEEIDAAATAEATVFERMIAITPTTLPGLFAYIAHLDNACLRKWDDQAIALAFPAVAEACRVLTPKIRNAV